MGHRLQILTQRLGRAAHQGICFLDIAQDARLCANLGAVGNLDMTDKTALTCYHTILSDLGGAAHTRLSRHSSVLPYLGVMGQHDEIVEFHTFVDARRTHGSTIDGGIGTNLHNNVRRVEAQNRSHLHQ